MIKTLRFLCVILLSAWCASGLDVNASKSDGIFHLHHFKNQNESKQIKFPPRETSCLFSTYHNISLNENICHVKRGLITFCSACADVNSHNKVVVCYVDGQSIYRLGKGQFVVENIDPMLFTHIIYAFAGLDSVNHSIKSLDSDLDTEEGAGFRI